MHEFHSVKLFIDQLVGKIPAGQRVKQLAVRRGAGFSEEAARLAFSVHAKGTPLEQAELSLEALVLRVACPCGFETSIRADEQCGYPFICPDCANFVELKRGPDLELIKLTYDGSSPQTSGAAGEGHRKAG